jgi:hypothetical protein
MKSVLAVVALLLACNASACINGGTDADIQAALDVGGDAVLCQFSSFTLYNTVQFKFPNTIIYTEYQPVGAARAVLHVGSSAVVTAVTARNISQAQLRNVIVDGGRPSFGYNRDTPQALVDFGGDASDQVVSWVEAYEPRGWSTVYMNEGNKSWNGWTWVGGCTGGQVTHNNVHNAGDHAGWQADGISYACRNGYVGFNTVTDATDGDIILFGAPGTLVEFNTVSNSNSIAFGGIAFDGIPYQRSITINGTATLVNDASGTMVRDNTIDSGYYFDSVKIRIGLAMGPRAWWSSCPFPSNEATVVYGATINYNRLSGANFNYGFVADGVDSLTAIGNDLAQYSYGQLSFAEYDCGGRNQEPSNLFNVHDIHATNSTIQTTITKIGDGDYPVLHGQAHHLIY